MSLLGEEEILISFKGKEMVNDVIIPEEKYTPESMLCLLILAQHNY